MEDEYPRDKLGRRIMFTKNDIGKAAIPKEDRCDDFEVVWRHVYREVMRYWDKVPVKDIKEFDKYQKVKELSE